MIRKTSRNVPLSLSVGSNLCACPLSHCCLTTPWSFYILSHQTVSSFHPSSCPPILSHQHWKAEVGAVCEQSAEWTRTFISACMSVCGYTSALSHLLCFKLWPLSISSLLSEAFSATCLYVFCGWKLVYREHRGHASVYREFQDRLKSHRRIYFSVLYL